MTDYPLVWHAKFPAKPASSSEESLQLLEMPVGLTRPRKQALAVEQLTPHARTVLEEALAALHRHAEGVTESTQISIRSLTAAERATVMDVLGEGDVWAQLGGNAKYDIVETALPGLWRIAAATPGGSTTEWLEVAGIPQVILSAAERVPRDTITIPTAVPQGAMNALPLLAELQERAGAYRPGTENHVINFTLLPITEVDAEVLTSVLGQIPLVIRSGGYGSCRIFATGLKHVWAVQYLNSMSKVILDTLEVGDVPIAARAAREDFEDSGLRLAEILQAYTT